MYKLSQINVYPIKSLGGVQVESARLTNRGLQHDRRWMLTDESGNFLSQRTIPMMSQLHVEIEPKHLRVKHQRMSTQTLEVPMRSPDAQRVTVTVFDDSCEAIVYPPHFGDWFSEMLDVKCQLVQMPDNAHRAVDPNYAMHNEQVSFADGYQSLIIGQASLDELNKRLHHPVTMKRFRPNLVFSGGVAHAEDHWQRVQIGEVEFHGVKLCARCAMTTVDPQMGTTSQEPLRTLSSYRKRKRGVMFGQNLLHGVVGKVAVGDNIRVLIASEEELE